MAPATAHSTANLHPTGCVGLDLDGLRGSAPGELYDNRLLPVDPNPDVPHGYIHSGDPTLGRLGLWSRADEHGRSRAFARALLKPNP